MQSFGAFGLHTELLNALAKNNFVTPTPIQSAAIPHALEGKDVMGTAQTGTGKTGAFGIPLISHLLKNPEDNALIMTPTRELAVQVMEMLKKMLSPANGINIALLIGGEPMPKQFSELRRKPRLIIGTPGRINDHLERSSLSCKNTKFLVLDETDRMLDMGFGIQIDKIITYLPKQRQTLMFSATMPKNILKLSGKYLTNPEHISTGSTTAPIGKIKQETVKLSETEKYDYLLTQLDERQGSIIVFVKTKFGAEKMAKKLRALKHMADAIHGDLRQNKRTQVIKLFRNQTNRIMVATDIAARGLDIPHIEHVINYDLPQCPEDYIHRIGRTARAGAEGSAINLVTPQDGKKWNAIHSMLNPQERSNQPIPKNAKKSKFKNTKQAAKSSHKPARFKRSKIAS